MKNKRKFYQDPWEAFDGYVPESGVTARNLPILIVVILLLGVLGWYVGKHPRVQEFIKKHSETQQEGTLKPSLLRSEPTAEANAWGQCPPIRHWRAIEILFTRSSVMPISEYTTLMPQLRDSY